MRAKREGGKGVNRIILAIAKPLVDFKRSDTLWLMRLFDTVGITAFPSLANKLREKFRSTENFHDTLSTTNDKRTSTRLETTFHFYFVTIDVYIPTSTMSSNIRLLK